MTENQQADCVQSRQAGFVRCCLYRLSALQTCQSLGDSAEVVQYHKEESYRQNEDPHRRRLHDHNAKQEQGCGVGGKLGVVDREGDIFPGIHDADAVADEIAGKGCDGCAHNAPDMDEDDVQHDVYHGCYQARPERVGGVLGRRVYAAEELVKAHHENAHDQHRRIRKCSGIFRIRVGVNKDVGEDPHKDNESGAGDKHKRLVCVEYPMIEPAAVLGVVLFDGGHIPRLEKNRRDGGNQIRDLGGNAVDAGSSFSDQTGRPGHIPDKQTVGKSGHQPEQGGRDQRNGELQHHAQDLLVHIPQPEKPVQSGDAPQEQSRQQVGQDNGNQKTGNTQMESGDKCNIKDKQGQRGENAVHGKEPHQPSGSHEL